MTKQKSAADRATRRGVDMNTMTPRPLLTPTRRTQTSATAIVGSAVQSVKSARDIIAADQQLAATRESTIQTAVQAEADVKRQLAAADADSLARGQWMQWSISIVALAVTIVGLNLGYPQAAWALLVPVAQIGGQLVRTVTRDRNGGPTEPEPVRNSGMAEPDSEEEL